MLKYPNPHMSVNTAIFEFEENLKVPADPAWVLYILLVMVHVKPFQSKTYVYIYFYFSANPTTLTFEKTLFVNKNVCRAMIHLISFSSDKENYIK